MTVRFEDYRQRMVSTIEQSLMEDDIDYEKLAEDIWLEVVDPVIDVYEDKVLTLEVRIENLEEEMLELEEETEFEGGE